MASIHVEDSGYVFHRRDAEGPRRQAYFPSIVVCPDGAWIASYDMGPDMEDPGVRTYVSRSRDGGRSWSEPAPIYDPVALGYPASTLGRICRIHDGALVGLITVCNRSRAQCGLANPETEGFVETRFGIVESHDAGRTWSPPRWVNPPIDWGAFETCSPILETTPDRWLLPTSTWRRWDGDCSPGMKAVVFVSADRGVTWDRCVDVMDLWERRIACWEQKQTCLSDGRLMAVCWAFSYAEKKSLRNRYSFSENGGDSYGVPHESPLDGETCTPLALPGNHVLCVYRRVDKQGLWAHLAHVEGERWAPLEDAPLWGTERSSYAASYPNKLEEMTTLQFGYPQCVQHSDGKVLVVFWCVEEGSACVRWVRLRIEEAR